MKKYIIIAGVNGAGKSTLYQTMDEIKDIPKVNIDDIVRVPVYEGQKENIVSEDIPRWYIEWKI